MIMNNHSDLRVYQNMVANPLAPMTLRIGVSGHRTLPEDQLPRLREEIKATYTAIAQVMQQIAATETAKALYVNNAKSVIRIISSMAEGADRLCIQPERIPFDYELAAILPFLKEDFEQDFLPENSVVDSQQGTVAECNAILAHIGYGRPTAQVIELDGDPAKCNEAYNNCSRLLVAHSDILIAVYDGKENGGNGTNAAMQKGIPVIHIFTKSNQVRRIHSCSCASSSSKASQPYTQTLLHQEISRKLLFTDRLENTGEEVRQEILERFKHYQNDSELCFIKDESPDYDNAGPIALKKEYKNPAAKVFDSLKNWLATAPSIQRIRQKHNAIPANAAKDPVADSNTGVMENRKNFIDKIATPSQDRYYAAFLYADRLANYYSRTHRSTFVLIYLFGAMALIAAACALALKSFHLTGPMFGLVLFELILLGMIYRLYQQDRHQQQYHKRWLEYRHLSEVLRPMHYLSLLGRTTASKVGYANAAGRI
jgi:hypothetical protein